MKKQSNPFLNINLVQDPIARKNFEALDQYFRLQNQLLDFKFFEVVFDAAETGRKVSHGLPFIPLDIIVTRLSGAGEVTFQYGEFTTSELCLDASGPCRIRFFAGTTPLFQTQVDTESTDSQTIQGGA